MKIYETNQIKNIALLGNSGSGKTTLAEAMLFEGGVIERRGTTDQKNTVSDYNEIEHENKASVFSSVLYTEYQEKKINIIDNPGLDDFVNGTIASLAVADCAVLLLNAQNGFEVGTEIHSRYLESTRKPTVLLVNQLDHEKANFDKTVEIAKDRIGSNVTIVQYPVNEGKDFNTFIDVLLMKMFKYTPDNGKAEITDIPETEKNRAQELHNLLVEKAAENDEKLMELFFEKGTLEVQEMRKGITAGLLSRGIFPIFVCSAKKNMGVGRFMEFLCNVAPNPADVSGMKNSEDNIIKIDKSKPASIFVFKTTYEQHIGEISYFKVITGEISEGNDLVNNNNQGKERISQIFVSAGRNRQKVSKLIAGDIGEIKKHQNSAYAHGSQFNIYF
jgi:elongation factor G